MSKLAVVVGLLGAPLTLADASAFAQGPAPAPAPAAPVAASATVTTAPVAPAPAVKVEAVAVTTETPATGVVVKGATGADGLVQVHIRTKELVTLEHRAGPEAPWQVACETPCDARVPAGDQYRVTGKGLNDSEPFALTSPKGDVVNISVAPGFAKREKVGKILTITGGVVFVGAVVIGLAAADPGKTFNADGSTNNYNWNVIAIGTGFALAGLTTAIVGGSFWYDNAHTRVAGDVQGDQPVRGGLEPRYQTGMRMITPNANAYTTTIFSHSF